MERVIEFNTEVEALTRNSTEAYSRGCDATTVTQHWWNLLQDSGGLWLLFIGSDVVADTVVEREDL